MFLRMIFILMIICGTIMGQEYKKIGIRNLKDGEKIYNIPWYLAKIDYNAIHTGKVFSSIICPQQTKNAYVGSYQEIEWCEEDEDETISFLANGISFFVSDNFIVSPGPSYVSLRWWLYDEEKNGKMSFVKGRYYVFCLSRSPKEKWHISPNELACDLDEELAYINGIIELEPLFDFNQQNKTPLFLSEFNFMSFNSDKFLIKRNKNFFYLSIEEKITIAPKLLLKRLFYAINTCQWIKNEQPQKFKFVSRTTIQYIDNGKKKKAVFQYSNGTWVMTMENVQYTSHYPYLMYDIASEVESLFEEK